MSRRVAYVVKAPGASEAVELAKATARDAGWRIRTIARVEPTGFEEPTAAVVSWRVTLAVEREVPA